MDYRQQVVNQSPAQQRWSKFKESHPDDFAMERERRKSIDEVRRVSLAAAGVSGPRHENFDRSLQDVDFRRRRPLLPLVQGASDGKDDIPQVLSLEHQEEIIMQADQQVQSGRMSHDEHQNLLRQLGQVFDLQRRQRQGPESDHGIRPRRADHRFRHRPLQDPRDVDHRKHLADSDFRRGGPEPRRLEGEDDRDFHHPEEEDIDFRRHGRREKGDHFASPRADFDGHGSPRADFDARGSPRADFDARRGPRPRRSYLRGEGPRDFDGREGSRHFDGPPADAPPKRPLLGLAPGVPLDDTNPMMDDRRPPDDFDERDPRWHDWPNRDFRAGPDMDYDDRGPPRDFDDRSHPEGHRGVSRDFDRRGPPKEFDRRGPPRDFDRRRGPRDFDERGPPPDFDERGPPEEYDPRGPPRGSSRGPPRGPPRGLLRGPPRINEDQEPPEEYEPSEDFDGRGPPRDFEGRGPPRDFSEGGPPRGPRGPPRDFDGSRSPRDVDGPRRPPRDFDGPSRPPRDFEGPPRPLRDFEGPPRPLRDFDGPQPPREFDVPRGPPRPLMPPPEGRPYNGPGPCGPRPRMDGPRPRLDGPRPRMDGPRPKIDGPRPRVEGPLPRVDRPCAFGPQGPRPSPSGPAGPERAEEMLPKIVPGSPMDDPRWSCMRGLLEKEVKEEVVIDGKPYEVKTDVRRRIKVNGQECEIYPDPVERGIRLNGKMVYKFGEPKKDVDLGHCVVEMFYHGPPLSVWIDGQQHRVRLDAPPLSMTFDNTLFGFQIDGRDKMILVDRLEKGKLGGPPRPLLLNGIQHEIAFEAPPRRILIDSQSCELKLDRKIPLIIYNGKPHGIRFEGGPRKMFIDDVAYLVPLDTAVKAKIGNRPHFLAFGGPAHEIIIDGKWYEVKFNNVPKNITIGNRIHSIRLEPPVPRVKILAEITEGIDETDLLLGQTQPGQLPRMQQPPLPPPALAGKGPQPASANPEGAGAAPASEQPIKKEAGDTPKKLQMEGEAKPAGPDAPPAEKPVPPNVQPQPSMPPVQPGMPPQGPPNMLQAGMGMQRMGGPMVRGPVMMGAGPQPGLNPMMLAGMMQGAAGMMQGLNMMSLPSTVSQIFPAAMTNPLMMHSIQRMMAAQQSKHS